MVSAAMFAFSALCALLTAIVIKRMMPMIETMEFAFLGVVVFIVIVCIVHNVRKSRR